jgi:hypothetical protein
MKLVNHQIEVEGYVSDTGNLCIAFDADDLVKVGCQDVLVINGENAEKFVFELNSLLKDLKNG